MKGMGKVRGHSGCLRDLVREIVFAARHRDRSPRRGWDSWPGGGYSVERWRGGYLVGSRRTLYVALVAKCVHRRMIGREPVLVAPVLLSYSSKPK